ncbi:MAG: type II toxin-antitoxin system RelE/ParE family toxin [Acidobacteria bacterium]|nr:type II toxin-antitoxin system RelE/ParE family toxin [Acidobacteriota bacterium]
MKPYRFLAEAQSEFEEQIRYFDEQVTGLGDRFIQALEDAVLLIRQHPMAGETVSKNVRKAVLRAFPFNVYYVNARDEVIIVAVAAHRRRPQYWRVRTGDLHS